MTMHQKVFVYMMQFCSSIMLFIWSLDPSMLSKILYDDFYYINMLSMAAILFGQIFIDTSKE